MPDARRDRPAPAAWAWAVAALTALVFSRSLSAGFLDYDDLHFIANNPHLRDASWSGLRWMMGPNWVIWYPLTWLSWVLDRAAWGDGPFGFHLTSVLLHSLNAALAFKLFDALLARGGAADAGTRRAAAAFAALAFSLHPLRVESVAWASERGDVLCGAFALATALAWVEESPWVAVVFHALGLASKGANVAMPLVLAALDALPPSGGKRPLRIRPLAAMLALSAADGLLNVSLQSGAGAAWTPGAFGPLDRLAISCESLLHGFLKTAWPSGLEGLYPLPRPYDPLALPAVLAMIAAAALTAAAWRARRRAPAAAGAWFAFLLLAAPTAGFFKVGAAWTADRYTYLSTLGFALLAGFFLLKAPSRSRAPVGFFLLFVLAVLTWAREGDYLDADRFWSAMIAADARNAPARTYLGLRRLKEGDYRDAEPLFRAALAIEPDDGPALNALGSLLTDTGRPEEAVGAFRAALAAHPDHPVTRYNLALALIKLGRRDEAVSVLRDELALIRARPRGALRDSFGPPGDEGRTRRLLDAVLPNGGVQ